MNRRKRKLVRVDLQFKVIVITLFVASFVLLINFQLLLAWLASFSARIGADASVDGVLEQTRSVIIHRFVVSLAIALPLSVSVAVLYSFRFCGPIYRFKKHFVDLVSLGRWDQPCRLRKGDQLTDLCEAINSTVSVFNDHVRTSHALLQEVDALLDDAVPATDTATRDRIQEIRESIREEARLFEGRLGAPNASDEGSATPSSEVLEEASATASVG